MTVDLDHLNELLRELDDSDLVWVETRIKRIKQSRKENSQNYNR